ncbi:MAG: conserved exported protein of unknown function [Nitrospira sp.]|nr:MAG: conserved exported protein of unknown function [Nitrospira sp.]
MKTTMIWICLSFTIPIGYGAVVPASLDAADIAQTGTLYTNARFGFAVRYPEQWRQGNPLPGGTGVTLHPPVEHSLVVLSGHMNLLEGTSQDGRQTLDEFAAAHRRIIANLYGKKRIEIAWQPDRPATLAGFPAKRLAFTYQGEQQRAMLEIHIFSLGRNEGRGVRIKVPVSAQDRLMPAVTAMLETYRPGRDQNAVSPLAPVPEAQGTVPHS